MHTRCLIQTGSWICTLDENLLPLIISASYGNDVLFDLGNGIDGGLAMEAAAGTWIYLEAMNVTGQLSVSTYNNAASESIYVDDINIWRGAVPAPGALALLGIAGVVSRRKRR